MVDEFKNALYLGHITQMTSSPSREGGFITFEEAECLK
jgi:hypothetical protein